MLACFSGGSPAQTSQPPPSMLAQRADEALSPVVPAARVAPTIPTTAAAPLRLKPESTLSESNSQVSEGRPTYATADRIEGRQDQETQLIGNAEIRRAGGVVRGDRLTYYPDDDEVLGVGAVQMARDGNVFTGPELRLKIDANEGFLASPEYLLGRFNGRGRARHAEFLGPDQFRLDDTSYTTCQASDPDWYLHIDQLTVDETLQEGRGKDANLIFKGRNVLWSPSFSFPLGDQRRSGFLAPTFSVNSRTGLQVLSPYYFNIAPNRDFTLYNRLMTRNGLQVGGWYRYLEPNYYGDMRFELNPHDRVVGESRHFYSVAHTFTNALGWSGGVNVRGVSDDNYFVDYSSSILNSALRNLPREVYAGRGFGDWSVMVRATRYQNILDARLAPAYERVPQVTANYAKFDQKGFDFTTLVDVANFRRPLLQSAEGIRALVNPQISYPVVRPGWFVTPKIGLSATHYQMSQDPAYDNSNYSRTLPTISVDSGMIFERQSKLFGRAVTQTLEPRLFYTYTPYRNQSQFPVFDTTIADFNFAQLFSTNTFIGNDRIADTNQLTSAVVSRFISQDTGVETLRLAFGQRYYFTPQRVTIPGVTNPTDRRSDLLFAASGDLGGGTTFDSGLQYSMSEKTAPRANIGVRHVSKDGRVLNFSVRYLRNSFGQVDVSWRQPIGRRWMTLGRINYSFLKAGIDPVTGLPVGPGLIEGLLGVEYLEDCWLLRLVAQRYVTAANTQTTAFFVQLELSGLGRIGTNPAEAIRRNIPGYRLVNERPDAPSNYYGYE